MANLTSSAAKALFAAAWADGGNTFRVLLTTAAYTPDAAHQFVSSVTNELAGGGYARKDLAGRTVTANGANYDCMANDVEYTALTNGQTAAWAIVYKFGTVDGDSTIIGAIAVSPTVIMVGDITIHWNATYSNGTVLRVS